VSATCATSRPSRRDSPPPRSPSGPVLRPVLKGGRVQAVPLTHSAAQIVKAYAKRAGIQAQSFAGHSLRSGFLTSAAEAGGASIWKMTEVSRHKSVDALRGYVRRADLFREHAGAAFL
jgi:integrase